MNKKQIFILIPLLIAVIGLMYYGTHGKPQAASIGNMIDRTESPIDYSIPDDQGDIIYGTTPSDGGPITFESTLN
jgi:hypothetical protein